MEDVLDYDRMSEAELAEAAHDPGAYLWNREDTLVHDRKELLEERSRIIDALKDRTGIKSDERIETFIHDTMVRRWSPADIWTFLEHGMTVSENVARDEDGVLQALQIEEYRTDASQLRGRYAERIDFDTVWGDKGKYRVMEFTVDYDVPGVHEVRDVRNDAVQGNLTMTVQGATYDALVETGHGKDRHTVHWSASDFFDGLPHQGQYPHDSTIEYTSFEVEAADGFLDLYEERFE